MHHCMEIQMEKKIAGLNDAQVNAIAKIGQINPLTWKQF